MNDFLDRELTPMEIQKLENEAIENFGDRFLESAIRAIASGQYDANDHIMIQQALAIVVEMYMNKVRSGEINQDKVMH